MVRRKYIAYSNNGMSLWDCYTVGKYNQTLCNWIYLNSSKSVNWEQNIKANYWRHNMVNKSFFVKNGMSVMLPHLIIVSRWNFIKLNRASF